MNFERIQTIAVGTVMDSKTKEVLITLGLVVIPFVWSGPQLMVGSVVNMLLCLTAANSQPKSWWIKAALPSLAVVARGGLFNSFTPYLLYLWPIITLGNWVFMSIGQSKLKALAKIKLPVAALIKMLILMTGATVLAQLKIIPTVMVGSMGIIQLVTALIGGTLSAL